VAEEDAPSTVVLMRAKSGSASLNARISVGQTNVKSLVVESMRGRGSEMR
jgi:hypothetical protein